MDIGRMSSTIKLGVLVQGTLTTHEAERRMPRNGVD